MTTIIVLLFLYVLPIAVGIFVVRFVLIKFKNKKIANRVSKALFSLLVMIFILVLVRDYQSRTHNLHCQITNNCLVEVQAIEQESYREWPILFTIIVKNFYGKTIQEFEFTTQNGPYLKFHIDSVNRNRLIIEGYKRNKGFEKIVRIENTKNDEIKEFRITGNFELIEERSKSLEIVTKR